MSVIYKLRILSVIFFMLQALNCYCQEVPVINVGEALSCKNVAPLSSIASKIEYTIMGEGELLMGDAMFSEVFYADEKHIYVAMVGTDMNAGCHKFTKDGKLVSSFVYKGRQGSEFSRFLDIDVAPDTKNIAVRDLTKVMIYDMNGKFINYVHICDIGDITSDFLLLAHSVQFLSGGKILLLGRDARTNEGYAVIYNIDGDLIMRKKISDPAFSRRAKNPIGGKYGTIYALQTFSNWNGRIKLITQNEDVIYSFDGQMNKKPAFALDFGKYRSSSLKKDWEESRTQISTSQFQENDRFIMFRVALGAESGILPEQNGEDGRMLTILYDKKNKTTYALKYDVESGVAGFVNDIDKGMRFKPTSLSGNKMYRFIDAATFISIADESSSAKMKEVASKLSEDSNPVLVTVTLL